MHTVLKNTAVVAAITGLVGAGAGFAGGITYQQSRRGSFLPGQFAGQNTNRTGGQFGNRSGNGSVNGPSGAGNRAGFRPVAGEIIQSDDTSITVKLADGSSKIVLLTDQTQINQAQTASRSALSVGVKVSVFGSANTDGSVTAQAVQLNPFERMMGGQPQQ